MMEKALDMPSKKETREGMTPIVVGGAITVVGVLLTALSSDTLFIGAIVTGVAILLFGLRQRAG